MIRRLRATAAALLGLWALSACSDSGPVPIGFLAGLTGAVGDLGKAGRDGALLALEQANAAGGVRGRKLELVVKDDRQDPSRLPLLMAELAEIRPAAVIGPMTSTIAAEAVPLADKLGLLLVSPTVASDALSGRDDNFLRVYPSLASLARQLAERVHSRLGLRNLTLVVDSGNAAYSGNYANHFSRAFAALGGTTSPPVAFRSGPDTDHPEVAARAAAIAGDGVLILAGAVDTALICQALRNAGDRRQIVVSEWSSTPDLINIGGEAVEGLVLLRTIDTDNVSATFSAFDQAFRSRFGYPPGFAGTLSYEAASIVIQALKDGTPSDQVRSALLKRASFRGLQSDIVLTPTGDIERPATLHRIRDGAMIGFGE